MKKILTIASCLVIFIGISAQAQHRHGVNYREHHQKARIHHGISSGQVTHYEAQRLSAEQRYIRNSEQCAKADGRFTRKERIRIERMENHASRDIYRQKHDTQYRPKAF
jgi:hypothetical protein